MSLLLNWPKFKKFPEEFPEKFPKNGSSSLIVPVFPTPLARKRLNFHIFARFTKNLQNLKKRSVHGRFLFLGGRSVGVSESGQGSREIVPEFPDVSGGVSSSICQADPGDQVEDRDQERHKPEPV